MNYLLRKKVRPLCFGGNEFSVSHSLFSSAGAHTLTHSARNSKLASPALSPLSGEGGQKGKLFRTV